MGEREPILDQQNQTEPYFVSKRRELETKYADLIGHINRWRLRYGEAWIHDEDYERVQESAEIVTESMAHDHRKFYIAYCLAIPLDERLTQKQEDDEKYPKHPRKYGQIERTIKGINDELIDLYYSQRQAAEINFLKAETLEEARKPYIMDERVEREMVRLDELKTQLMERLPHVRKARCEDRRTI